MGGHGGSRGAGGGQGACGGDGAVDTGDDASELELDYEVLVVEDAEDMDADMLPTEVVPLLVGSKRKKGSWSAELPMRRSSWVATGGGSDLSVSLARINNDDLQEAALRGDVGLVRRLTLAGASVNAPIRPESDDDFMTLLHILASKPELPNGPCLVSEIIKMRANLDARTTSGITPLALACLKKNSGAVAELLDARADPTPVDDLGRNAARCLVSLTDGSQAEQARCVEMIGLFAEAGTNLDDGGDVAPIVEAVKSHSEPVVRKLIGSGAAPDGLHEAVEFAPISLILCLLEAEVNPFKKDPSGKSVMDLALARGNGAILNELRDYIGDLQRKGHAHLKTLEEETVGQSITFNARVSALEAAEMGATATQRTHASNSWKFRLAQRWTVVQVSCRKVSKRFSFQLAMLFALLVALFLPDIWVAIGVELRGVIDCILMIVLFCFLVELLLQLVGQWRTYRGTFFFWMDIVGLLSVPLDLSIVADGLSGVASGPADTLIMRLARMAKLGTRAGRFTRLMKVLRFLPGVKEDVTSHTDMAKAMAARLNHVLTIRVSCVIIIMVIVCPCLQIGTFPTSENSMLAWLEVLQQTVTEQGPDSAAEVIADLDMFYSERNFAPFRLGYVLPDGTLEEVDALSGEKPKRSTSILKVELDGSKAYMLVNLEGPFRVDALANCTLIFIIMVLMAFSTLVMSNAISAIVLLPLESLMSNVKGIASKIFASVTTMASRDSDLETVSSDSSTSEAEANRERVMHNETQLLEKILKKIGTVSEIHAKQAPLGEQDYEQLGEADRALLQAYTTHSEAAAMLRKAHSEGMPSEGDSVDAEELEVMIEDRLVEADLTLFDLEAWEFAVLNLSENKQFTLCLCALTVYRGLTFGSPFGISDWGVVCTNFVKAVEAGYNSSNPYHNFVHAVDVCITTHRFLETLHAHHYLTKNERFCLVVAALAHDIGHPGLNNPFLVETLHELAIRYNDLSPLENMHCARLFEIASQPECDVFVESERQHRADSRRIVIESVLHTDHAHHFALVKELQKFYDGSAEIFDISAVMYRDAHAGSFPSSEVVEIFRKSDNKKLLLNTFVHFCDVSNPTKQWGEAMQWAELLTEEFYVQGDQEKALGITVQPLNDRDKSNAPYSQIGYIEFFVAPLLFAFEKLAPPAEFCTDVMLANMGKWAGEWVQRTDPQPEAELQASVWDRISKLEARRSAV